MSGTIEHMDIKATCPMCSMTFTLTQLEQRYCSYNCKRAKHVWSGRSMTKQDAVKWAQDRYGVIQKERRIFD